MKAFTRIAADSQEIIQTEVPLPSIEQDEVLVKVAAFGVGIHDRYFIPSDASFPYVIGSEGAGIIEKCGSNVNYFSEGDYVIYTTALHPKGGTWATYAVAKKETVITRFIHQS